MKTKLFIDFDGTIFDTVKFCLEYTKVFRKSGYSLEEFESAYQAECLDYKFSLDDLVDRLHKIRPSVNLPLLKARIENLYKALPNYLYWDSIDFLKKLDREKYQVNLLTLGDANFQIKKVNNSNIRELFDNLYFCDIQKWIYLDLLVKSKEDFILIDDRGDTIDKVSKKFSHALALQIERRDEDKNDPVRVSKEFDNRVVHSFKQAMMYLN